MAAHDDSSFDLALAIILLFSFSSRSESRSLDTSGGVSEDKA